ncbi:MAG: YceI family protein [Pedosphaera sp.]|nr:YceI family protein [Pedosphaera sp.]
MKHFHVTTLTASAAVLLFVGCSDPADKVHKTAASEPQKASSAPSKSGKEYVVRAESTIGFVGSKVTGNHNGGFKKFAGKINAADGKIVGTPEIKISMPSVWTDNDRVTGHLQSPDFFDVKQFPVSTFTITSIESSAGQQKVTGNLSLHGVTKSVSFPANIQVADNAVAVKADFAINRKDFNINYPGKPNDLIRDNVVIKLDIKATPGASRPQDQLGN